MLFGSLWKRFKGRDGALWQGASRNSTETQKHAEHPVCARGEVEKGSFWRHRRRCLIWMQLIRKVDWFDGTSGAGQQSALVCEGVHAQVDIYAFQGSFNNNIKGSMKKPCFLSLCFSSRTLSTHNYTFPFLIRFSLLSPWLCSKYLTKHCCDLQYALADRQRKTIFNEMLFMVSSCSQVYKSLLIIHFIPCLFLTLGQALSQAPVELHCCLLCIIFFALFQFSWTIAVFIVFLWSRATFICELNLLWS